MTSNELNIIYICIGSTTLISCIALTIGYRLGRNDSDKQWRAINEFNEIQRNKEHVNEHNELELMGQKIKDEYNRLGCFLHSDKDKSNQP